MMSDFRVGKGVQIFSLERLSYADLFIFTGESPKMMSDFRVDKGVQKSLMILDVIG